MLRYTEPTSLCTTWGDEYLASAASAILCAIFGSNVGAFSVVTGVVAPKVFMFVKVPTHEVM